MAGISTRSVCVAGFLACLVAGLLVSAESAYAEGTNLDGRTAPEMVFPSGTNGIAPGTSLSSLRGKVVWVKFVLRDCPLCRKTLPRAQQLHERWGGSGLVVLVVVHKFGPEEMRPLLQERGYTFPVASDPTGRLAQRYGVRRRPTDYVVGVDGRIRASNGASDEVLRTELGRYRLSRLGEVPAELSAVREAVWRWDYGTALRTLEAAAAEPGASPAIKALAARVAALAREELDARVAYAEVLAGRGETASARAVYDRVVPHFQGTALEQAAIDARARFTARAGG